MTTRRAPPARRDERKPPRLAKEVDPTGELQRHLDEAHADRQRIARFPEVNGVAVTGIVFLPGETKVIPHKLGRAPAGYRVTRIVGGPQSLRETTADDKTITLTNDTAAWSIISTTVDLWVW